jgi:hypothetical protein
MLKPLTGKLQHNQHEPLSPNFNTECRRIQMP